MKFKCNTKELSAACQNVQKAVSVKSTMPSIAGILIEADSGIVKLTGYDLEMGITTQMNAVTEKDGKIIISAKILCEILRKLPGDYVEFESDERQMCQIKSGYSEFSVVGISADEFPELPIIDDGKKIDIECDILKSMIRQTVFSVAVLDNKPIYMGIKFEIKENEIKTIGLDGNRMAIRKEKISYSGENMSFVVPAKTLNEVVKLGDEQTQIISVIVNRKHIIFKIDDYCIISRLLEGDFLNYNAVIPNGNITKVQVKTQEFLQSIERTTIVVNDRLKSPVRCIFADDIIKISCINANVRVFDKIPAQIMGARVEIGFNGKFFLDALKAADCDEIIIEMNGTLNPIKITPVEGDSFLFIVLPVRLKN